MADPTDVKRALRALAYGTTDCERRRLVVADAVDALNAVADAADFCETTGVRRLRRATRAAQSHGKTALAREGQHALTTLDRYRRVAAREGGSDKTVTDGVAGTADGRDVDGEAHAVHFHSARGTTLPGAGQRGDR